MKFYFYKWGVTVYCCNSCYIACLDYPVLFSERYMHRKVWRLGRFAALVKRRINVVREVDGDQQSTT